MAAPDQGPRTAVSLIGALLLLAPDAPAQRYIPAAGQWTTPPAGHPLGSGNLENTWVYGTGSLAEGSVSDSGYFLHRDAGEGDDFRVCLGTASTLGVSGVMVRDSAAPDSAFVFAGTDAAGNTVVLYRHEAGAPAKRIPFAATGSSKWFRLVVGRDTVYAFNASASTPGLAGAWSFLAAVKIQLAGGAFQERRADLAGLFISHGPTSFLDLYQTSQLIWSETTATIGAAIQAPPDSWTVAATGPDQFAESPVLLKREDAGSQAHVEFPVTTVIAGFHNVFLHAVAGNGSPVKAALVIGGVQQTVSDLENVPLGVNSWLYLGSVTTTPGAGKEFKVRVFDPGSPGSTVYADAVRAVFVNAREIGALNYPGWTETPGDRIVQSGGWTAANDLRRNATAANNTWNAGAYSYHVLVGDGVFKFRFIGNELRMQAGLTDYPWGNDPAMPFL